MKTAYSILLFTFSSMVFASATNETAKLKLLSKKELQTSKSDENAKPMKAVKRNHRFYHRKRAIVLSPTVFDFQYQGDIVNALSQLAYQQPQLNIRPSVGKIRAVPVSLDLSNVTLSDVLRAMNEQGAGIASLVYNGRNNNVHISFTKEKSLGSTAIEESKKWQLGGNARPIMGADGLLQFPFGQYQPELTCRPLFGCDVQLQSGEIINNVIVGDTVRWITAPAKTGEGTSAIEHVIVKPSEVGLSTNMTITTNRRTYMLLLKSSKVNYVARLGFYYPSDIVQSWHEQAEEERRKVDAENSRKISDLPISSLAQLNLDGYRMKGDRYLAWYPVRVFDEGTHVFIQMPPTIKSSEAPALVLVGKDGNAELVNYRVKEAEQGGEQVTYYVVDKLFEQAALITGVGSSQQKVEIFRKQR